MRSTGHIDVRALPAAGAFLAPTADRGGQTLMRIKCLGSWAWIAAIVALSACTDDVPVTGSKCDGPCVQADGGVDAAVSETDVPPVAPTVNFYAETKIGNVLEGSITTAQIDGKNDLSPEQGIQINIVVQTTNAPDGSPVQLSLGGQPLGAAGVISKGSARFDGIKVPCAVDASVIGAVVTVSPTVSGQASKSLQVQCGDACNATLVAVPACLTDDADPQNPGFQYTFTVKTDTPSCSHAYLKVVDAEGNPVTSVEVALNGAGSVPVKVTLSSKSKDLNGATAKVTAVVKDETGTRPEGESAVQVVTLTTESPVVTVSAPLPGQLTLTDDIDPTAPGIQVLLKGTATTLSPADINAVEIAIEGTATVQTSVQADGSFALAVSFGVSKVYSVKVTAKNACGLSGSATAVYTVFANSAGLVIAAPTAGAVLLAKDDGDLATPTIYEMPLTVAISDGTADADISIFCRKNALGAALGSKPVGVAKYTSGLSLNIPTAIDTVQYGTSVACIAMDNAPNGATSAEVAFTLALPAPCLKIQSPIANSKVNSTEINLVAVASDLEGAAVSLQLKAATGVVFDPIAAGKASATGLAGKVALQPAGQKLLDGEYTLTLSAADKFGNQAGASLCSDVTRTLTLDTTGPTVAIALPTKATLTTLDDPDSAPNTLGYQVDVTVNIVDAVEVCIEASSGEKACKLTTVADKTVVFVAVTLQPGLNTITATAKDELGNQTTAAPWIGTLVSAAPIIKFSTPTSNPVVTTPNTLKFVALVSNIGGAPVKGATTAVLIDGVAVPVGVVETSAGVYEFIVGNLNLKPSTTVVFTAKAVGADDKDKGVSPAITVTFKSTKPAVAISAPTDKAVLNGTSALCVAGSQDCLTTVTATTTDIEADNVGKLVITCGKELPVSATATVAAGKLTFANVVLKDQTTCTLVVTASDSAQQAATSAPVSVSLDRIAPKFALLSSPLGKDLEQLVFTALDDQGGDPSDGVQIQLGIFALGVGAGQAVTVDVVADNGTKVNYKATTVNLATDTGQQPQLFGLVTLPEGDAVKLVFTTTDSAGNVGTKTLIATVQPKKGVVKLGDPLNNFESVACTVSSQCAPGFCVQGKCAAAWITGSTRQITLTIEGFSKSGLATARICTNAAGVQGDACATPGYKTLATTTVKSTTVAFVLPNSLPDGLYTFVGETSQLPTIDWISSIASDALALKLRTVLIDTKAPTVVSITPPTAVGAANCLNEASQTKADLGAIGGTFAFAVAVDGNAVVTVGGGGGFGSAAAANNVASVPVTVGSEGSFAFNATAKDEYGNVSAAVATGQLLIDTQKPVGAFSSPGGAKVLATSSLDVKVVSQSADTEGQDVAVKDGAAAKGTEKMLSGAATFTKAKYNLLTDGNHTLVGDVRDVCANIASVATTPAQVTVDTSPPTVSFSAPAQGATFGDAQDADAAVGGYQVSWLISVGDTVSYTIELGDGCDASFANCTAFKTVDSGNSTGPTIASKSGTHITIPFGASQFYSVRATLTDANGNTTSASRGFKVALTGCLVSLKGLPTTGSYTNASCAVANTDCASLSTTVTAELIGPCGTVANLQFKKGAVEVGKKPPVANGATVSITVNDGDNTTVEAIALDASNAVKGTSGALALKADLSAPKVDFGAGTVVGVPTLAGPGPKTVGKKADASGSVAGHQIHLQIQASDAGLKGGKLVKLERKVGTTTVTLSVTEPASLPVVINGNTVAIDIQLAVLQENASNVITATVADAAGNLGVGQITIVVDWVAPAAPVLAAFKSGDLNPRRPLAKLSLTAVGDDGSTGTAKTYLVRYSATDITTQDAFDKACDPKKLPFATIPVPAAAGTAQQIFVEGPDPRLTANTTPDVCKFVPFTDGLATSKWFFAVQVEDAAGNLSPISNVVSTAELALRFATIKLGGTLNTNDMRSRVWRLGDLNGDGLADFALGGGTVEPLCVVYGRVGATIAEIDLSTKSAYPSHLCLDNPGGLGAPVARAGDVNGDGIDDLVVGVGAGTGLPRSVRVYLGKKNAAFGTTPVMTINNLTVTTGDGVWKLNTIGNFNGDTSPTGKPIADIAVTCRSSVLSYDRVLVVPGSAAWNEAAPKTLNIDNQADRIANKVATIRGINATGTPTFGHSITAAGNMLADTGGTQYDDVVISQQASAQSVYVIKGRPITSDMEIVVDLASATLSGEAGTVVLRGSGAVAGNALGLFTDVVQVDGDAVPDLVVQHSQASTAGGGLYWFRGAFLAGNLGKAVILAVETVITGTSDLLFSVAGGYRLKDYHWSPQSTGNFCDRPGPGTFTDIVHARTSAAANGANNRVVIRFGMIRPLSAVPNEVSFLYEDLVIYDPASPVGGAKLTNWGNTNFVHTGPLAFGAIGDFNGDALPDLVIGSLTSSLIIVY